MATPNYHDLEIQAYILGAVTAGGGIMGYARTRSVPSIVAGCAVGLLYGLGGYRIQNEQPYGVELGLLASIVLGGSAFPRAIPPEEARADSAQYYLGIWLADLCAYSVSASGDATTLANAIFGQGITILQAQFSGAAISSGTFTDGPFGIGNAGILTSGAAEGSLAGGDHYVNNGAAGSDTYCGSNTFNAAILTVDFLVQPGYNGVDVEFIIASEEEGGSPDPIGIFLGGQQYAIDPNGDRLTATSPYLAFPLVIVPPNSVTSYPGSSPPLILGILGTGAQTMVLSICDFSDTEWDSALLVKVSGCTDCDTELRLDYVTSTTTVGPGETTFTSTRTASGTVSGTITIGVLATTTTTSEESTTTTTTTSEESTTTTTTTSEESTTTTTTTSEESTTTTTTTSEESTTTTTTTSEESTTTTTTTSEESTTTTTTSEESTTTTTSEESTTTTTTTTSEESTTTTTSTSEESTTTTTTTSEESTTTTTTSEESTTTTTTTSEESTTTTTSEESTTTTTTSQESTTTTSESTTESTTDSTTDSTTTSEVSSSTDSSTSTGTTDSTSSSSMSEAPTAASTTDTTSRESTTTSESMTGSDLPTIESTTSEPTTGTSRQTSLAESTTQTSESVSTLVSTTESAADTSFGSSTDTQTTSTTSVSTDGSARPSSTTASLSTTNNPDFQSSTSPVTSSPSTTSVTTILTSTPSSTPTATNTDLPTFTSSVESSTLETLVPDTSTTTSAFSSSSSVAQSLSTTSLREQSTFSIEPTDLSTESSSAPTTSLPSGSRTVPESSSTSTTATTSATASNLPRIGQYEFVGCLGSSEGYPTFDLVGSGPDLTTVDCISLGEGRAYIGIFNRSCYAADSLSFTALVGTGSCDIPCPGDPGLFCGGLVDPNRPLAKRSELGQSFGSRAAPAGILLTLYGLADALPVSSSDSSAIDTETRDQTSATALESESVSNTISSLPVSVPTSAISSADISFIPSASQSLSNSDLPVLPSASDSDDNPPSESFPTLSVTDLPVVNPNNPIPLPSAPFQIGNFSAAATNLETLVTTVVYTIIDPHNPSYLTVTEICTTMKYAPCRQCQQPRLPTVEMTTIKTTCDACGYHGENTVTLTIPMCALTASATAEPIVLEPVTRVEARPAASAGWENPPLHVRPSKAVVHAGPPYLPAEHLLKETQRPHGDDQPIVYHPDEPLPKATQRPQGYDQPVVYDSDEPASQGQDQPVVYDHDGPASYEHDQPQPKKPHDVEINGGETPETSSEDDQTQDREQDKPIPTVEKPQEPHVEAQSPDHEDDHTPPARETVQEPHQDNHSPASELPTPVASHQREQPTIVASHNNDYSNQDEPAVPNLPPNPVAQPTNAVPLPKLAGPPEEPKVIPAVSTAIVPDMPPDSPIVVVAGSIQKQINGVLMLFVFIAGLFVL
ncbi:hypothetical protein NM208_g12574 [Fusarium decemcellulare]|uniref:Uncharacterized protein n=1 Tax=Fusarium decemcellulare TaxID=57161 RepID=A0ACC1RPB2_9HYPO|nr:hypothetical protein NM208_g12574 [Fusarium decemcellulare]